MLLIVHAEPDAVGAELPIVGSAARSARRYHFEADMSRAP
jgi:hypothetical protein